MSEIIVSERVSNFEMPIVYSVIMHLIHKKHVLKIIIMLFVMLLDCMALQVTIKLDTRPTSGANLQEPSQSLPLMTSWCVKNFHISKFRIWDIGLNFLYMYL
jgi:hypothetical protein